MQRFIFVIFIAITSTCFQIHLNRILVANLPRSRLLFNISSGFLPYMKKLRSLLLLLLLSPAPFQTAAPLHAQTQAASSPAAPSVTNTIRQEERAIPAFEHLWHRRFTNFVADDLPRLIIDLIIAFLLSRIALFFVNRMRKRADHLVANSRRSAQLRTVAGIVRATSYAVIVFWLLVETLPLFHIQIAPLLASAGVIGLGISFGAQSIFKDMLNGMFILIEDQYNVGDNIKVAGLTGSVEDLTLRVTTLRDGDGTQHIIPNSQIATVSNLSREFSVASLPVSIDATADPDRVIKLLRQIATEVRHDEAFKDIAIADPDVPGIDRINGREVIYPINIRVRANQRDPVMRELRRRVIITFEREQIPLGSGSGLLLMQQKQDPTAPPAPPKIGV